MTTTLPLKHNGYFVFPTIEQRFVTYEDSDVPYLMWSRQCRLAGRGENRTLRCLYDVRDKALESDIVFFVSSSYTHSDYAKNLFMLTFCHAYELHGYRNRIAFLPENTNSLILFRPISYFDVIGYRNFDFVLDHEWNQEGAWSPMADQCNWDKVRLAQLRRKMFKR